MKVNGRKIRWAGPGDVNAFFGLMLDNVSNLIILASLLTGVFGMPRELVLYRMIPGSALGVLVGDLIYTWMAFRLAAKTGRSDVTAMPLGLDTPSLFGVALGIVGPVYMDTGDAHLAWQVGMASVVIMGVVKVILSFFGERVRAAVPRAGLLGSIAGIAILLIAFLPLLKIFETPVAGLVSLGVVFATLIAGLRLPLGIPGAFGAVLAGTGVYYLAGVLGGGLPSSPEIAVIHVSLPLPSGEFLGGMKDAIKYASLSIPFAVATVIGGIDVTESAAVAGDDYDTREILLAEGIATLIAGLCGGVIQSTPYIGHPAYKKMGGRAGYTLATALFIGIGGMVGFLPYVISIIPEAAVAPILVFIGVEIMTQAYAATPREHYQALSISLLPSAAYLVCIEVKQFIAWSGASVQALPPVAVKTLSVLYVLSNGFILTALLWGGAFAHLSSGDRRRAFVYTIVLAGLSLFGVIHSVMENGALYLPWKAGSSIPFVLALSYLFMGASFYLAKKERADGRVAAYSRLTR